MWKLVVIHHHGETFGRMLSDKRLYDTESLTDPGVPTTHVPRKKLLTEIHPYGIYPYSSIAWGYLRCIHSRLFLHIVQNFHSSGLNGLFINPS